MSADFDFVETTRPVGRPSSLPQRAFNLRSPILGLEAPRQTRCLPHYSILAPERVFRAVEINSPSVAPLFLLPKNQFRNHDLKNLCYKP